MKVYFNFRTRQAMQVAMAVAEELERGTRPVLLSIKNTTFRFEGGAVIKVYLSGGKYIENGNPPIEEWMVTHCEVRYYPRETDYRKKREEVWDAKRLLALKTTRWWWHPHVQPAQPTLSELVTD